MQASGFVAVAAKRREHPYDDLWALGTVAPMGGGGAAGVGWYSLSGVMRHGLPRCARNDMAHGVNALAGARMEQGNLSNVEWFRGIGEYKIDWGPGYRIYLAKDGARIIVLLGGGNKKRQQKDIDQAVALWEDYKRHKSQLQKGT